MTDDTIDDPDFFRWAAVLDPDDEINDRNERLFVLDSMRELATMFRVVFDAATLGGH